MRSALGAVLVIAVAACGGSASHGDAVDRAEGAWGLLNDDALTPEGPQFLVNKKKGEHYRVCLPSYMATVLPGVDLEVTAAINVWASYVGRAIPVDVVTKDLPRARADQSVDDVSKAYHDACGPGFDVVMGFAKLDDPAVGLTGASYQYRTRPDGSRQITAFSRYLFLRDYDLEPSADDEGNAERWIASGATSSDALLATMIARTDTRYVKGNAYLALPVIVHEYGHVWGLCDQYEGTTNCDPRNSTSHIVESAIMGARGATQHLYLTDDDVQGIRALGGKLGFDHDWGAPPTAPPVAVVEPPVALARVESVKREGSQLLLKYGVVTSVPATYAFELSTDGTRFFGLSSDFESAEPFDVPIGRLHISMGAISTSPYRVRLTVTPQGGDPVTVSGAE